MKTGIILGILLALILALIPYLPVVAQETGTITITMTGVNEISITVSPTSWSPAGEGGIVSPDTPYLTDSTWFTLTIAGNCNANTFIAGEDAVCVADSTYKWTLSSDGNNDKGVYVLSVKSQRGETVRDYFYITKPTEEESLGEEFWPWSGGSSSSLAPGEKVQFGLKLKTPSPDFTEGGVDYFSVGDATMETHITISAVAA